MSASTNYWLALMAFGLVPGLKASSNFPIYASPPAADVNAGGSSCYRCTRSGWEHCQDRAGQYLHSSASGIGGVNAQCCWEPAPYSNSNCAAGYNSGGGRLHTAKCTSSYLQRDLALTACPQE